MYNYVVMQSCISTIGKEHVIDFRSSQRKVLFVCWHWAIGFLCHMADAMMTADDIPHLLL